MTRRVRDLMRSNLITCPPSATLGEVAGMLVRHRIHAIVVADASGMQQGLVSDIDLLAGEWLAKDPPSLAAMRAMTAEQVMSAPVATIDADAPMPEAAERMRTERMHRLVVTEMDRAIGVVSIGDLVVSMIPPITDRHTVEQVMSRGLVVCRADTTLGEAARAMTERRSRSVVVVDPYGKPLGVITGLDLLPFVPGGHADRPVTDVMHPPLTIGPKASLAEAADLMLRHHVHRLVVTDPGHPDGMPLGLISTSDIVVEMAAPGSVWQIPP
jgi:CBS domain-containing protein